MSESNIDDTEGHYRHPADEAENLESDDVEGHYRHPADEAENLESDDTEGHGLRRS
jgi:hypothetical protein